MKKTLGGDRLGSGNKMKVEMHNFERSTHNLGYIWRTTMSPGTLVPFMKKVGLPGDSFDIDLDAFVNTHPTIGPLFGSFKMQLDVFMCPIRLYQGQLHNNKLGIGLKMSTVKLPLITLEPNVMDQDTLEAVDIDNAQINPSCILSYLGIRGAGIPNAVAESSQRKFNAIPLLAYWDIYKNYYANKQEEIGAVIHTTPIALDENINTIVLDSNTLHQSPTVDNYPLTQDSIFQITVTGGTLDENNVVFNMDSGERLSIAEVGTFVSLAGSTYNYTYNWISLGNRRVLNWDYRNTNQTVVSPISVTTWPLEFIDTMRERILAHSTSPTPFDVNSQNLAPYRHLFETDGADDKRILSMQFSQEGLGLKTYQSDKFNNWLQTEWIDGVDGISAITAVDTSGGDFTIDTLNLSKKVYDMLNRIAVSGGSYDDWIDAVYMHDRYTRAESPMYMGGLIKEVVFQEVISNSEAEPTSNSGNQPLGTLAGKGKLADKHKGGNVTIKVDEPSYIIGIVSLTPRIDYSQGNDWDIHLATMDDFHKPNLDEIGFQELITEQMAWWDTNQDTSGNWITKSAGKQPAWINYMTAINKTYGNFAIANNEMFMTLNRRYQAVPVAGSVSIGDVTTYIDPTIYNQIFAQTSLDSQNFWVQIGVDITARRKMSAKLMPNL